MNRTRVRSSGVSMSLLFFCVWFSSTITTRSCNIFALLLCQTLSAGYEQRIKQRLDESWWYLYLVTIRIPLVDSSIGMQFPVECFRYQAGWATPRSQWASFIFQWEPNTFEMYFFEIELIDGSKVASAIPSPFLSLTLAWRFLFACYDFWLCTTIMQHWKLISPWKRIYTILIEAIPVKSAGRVFVGLAGSLFPRFGPSFLSNSLLKPKVATSCLEPTSNRTVFDAGIHQTTFLFCIGASRRDQSDS